ncbi:MAG TPA: hypothetical protein VF469_13200, partial [Kofleriaceae bacterium]
GCLAGLRSALSRIDTGPVRDLGALAKHAYESARITGWFDGRDCREIEQLLGVCATIPLIGFAPRSRPQRGDAPCEPTER